MTATARLAGIYCGAEKGAAKTSVAVAELVAGHGLQGDVHAGTHPRRHVSLFAQEVWQAVQDEGFHFAPGELSANLFTANLPLDELQPGTQLRVGAAILEIVQLRKPCHSTTRINNKLTKRLYGQCGQLASVLVGGTVHTGDVIEILAAPASLKNASHAG